MTNQINNTELNSQDMNHLSIIIFTPFILCFLAPIMPVILYMFIMIFILPIKIAYEVIKYIINLMIPN